MVPVSADWTYNILYPENLFYTEVIGYHILISELYSIDS